MNVKRKKTNVIIFINSYGFEADNSGEAAGLGANERADSEAPVDSCWRH